MTKEEYLKQFSGDVAGPLKAKAEKALDLALDIRKFEIELYWKRATYFWAFIAASLAGYALVYKTTEPNPNAWLSLVFSSLGFLFSVAWYLVNRGSKFWQNNWERHVDILEDEVYGPLYKTIAYSSSGSNPLTAAGQYSVSKINQILSFIVSLFWLVLFVKSSLPISSQLETDYIKVATIALTVLGVLALFCWSTSDNDATRTKLQSRSVVIAP
jgi:hypothetical protein